LVEDEIEPAALLMSEHHPAFEHGPRFAYVLTQPCMRPNCLSL
jgi:hypothetical protein